MAKVVALRSFFGAGMDVKKGAVLDVSNGKAESWVKAGLVRKANADEAKTAKATTPSTPAPKAPSEPTEPETTGEVVTEPETPNADENANDSEADKEPTNGDDVKTDDKPETPSEPEAPVVPLAPVDGGKEVTPPAPTAPQNNKSNAKKGSK